VEKNVAMAARLYRQAAEQGVAGAQFRLGMFYYIAEGVENDKTKAARLFRQAAEQGCAFASLWLGWCYEHGQGTGQDASAAAEQYRLAVEGGCADANASLGLYFEKGRGVPRSDPAEAARLYALAAEGGTLDKAAFAEAIVMLPDKGLAPGVPSAAARARTRHAVHQLNLAAEQLEALAGRRDVVSACCVGCGAVRKLKTCSKCRIARFCDTEDTARMWRRTRRAARRGALNQQAAGPRAEGH
jgi:TPR repeat protein